MALDPAAAQSPMYFLDTDATPDAALALSHLVGIGALIAGIGASAPDTNRLAARTLTDLAGLFGSHRIGVYPAEPGPASDIDVVTAIAHVSLPRSTGRVLRAHAASALIQLARRHPGQLRVVALGSARNLAEAVQLDPDLPQLLAGVTALTTEATHADWTGAWAAGLPLTLVPRHRADSLRLSDDELTTLAGRGGAHYLLSAMMADYSAEAPQAAIPLAGALAAAVAADTPSAPGRVRATPPELRTRVVDVLLDRGARSEALKVVA